MGLRELPPNFLVAFSFAGEERPLITQIAELVEERLGRSSVFFDEWFEHYIAGNDADLRLQEIYSKRSSLIVVCVSGSYGKKAWTRAEHEVIRARLMQLRLTGEDNRVLPLRVGEGEIPGIPFNAIVPDVRSRPIEETADLIVARLRLTDPDGLASTPWSRRSIERLSHEINAPLTAIRGNLSYLRLRRQEMSDEKVQRALEDMETDATVLHYVVQELEHTFAGDQAKASIRSFQTESIRSVGEVVCRTIRQLTPLVRDSGLDPKSVICRCERGGDRELQFDSARVGQVLFNLFLNATKYFDTKEDFRIEVIGSCTHNCYAVRFCDWGIGIPAGLEEHVFRQGYRSPTSAGRVVGSGLGLTIARQLMREIGGDITLVSRYKPTEFQLSIAYKEAPLQ
jgi:signal transduction histidine kinase